ncbi:putative glycogen debranching enzyme [Azospirillum fermentarium]|uniref:amylo-alpha-1,6-glucosidase n=1 Tax=Azospirillum fermentarium TaxID=1233114 RepID=UPI0022262957|nr:amylo-alpha-1,6-glucosidase [Azospirillum fermentarium]MCW2249400.1 putative glycogen debranching enzyme [Azospirillum fermentarium]
MHENPSDPKRVLDRSLLTSAPDAALRREWLVPNGLGGFASATVAGTVTRRYHGLLVAALPAPLGRVVMLSQLNDVLVTADGSERVLTRHAAGPGPGENGEPGPLSEFRLEMGLPVWRYTVDGTVIEKQVVMPHRQNIVHVTYRVLKAPGPVTLRLRPVLAYRTLEAAVDRPMIRDYRIVARGSQYEVWAGDGLPTLNLAIDGPPMPLTLDGGAREDVLYRLEAERGYEARGPLWTPGYFSGTLGPGQSVTFVAAVESWRRIEALPPADVLAFETERRRRLVRLAHPSLRHGPMAELVLAADSFIFVPAGRVADMMRARAEGDEVRTILAGYHWFTDWGRDTMISLEGLTLATGRTAEAGWILRTFAHYIRDGLIPNMFPDGRDEGLYHTADATLWFFHALNRYLRATGDRHTLHVILPHLTEIISRHRQGTRFGIAMDPADGLLRQGQEGYQLTWMDAKVDDWVVTPRRGKAVEINALWYNALCLTARWLRDAGHNTAAADCAALAERVRESFNRRFWNDGAGCLYDVIDGEYGGDDAVRPNQLFALSLDNPVLDRARWPAVLDVVRRQLLTPLGLRSLAPGHRDYKAKYFGDLRARDAAYHQGTVWGWLIGPMVDAALKVDPGGRAEARAMLTGFLPHLNEAGLGTISEIFDAEAPFAPRGCIAQAWSVAEVLRAWIATEPEGKGG